MNLETLLNKFKINKGDKILLSSDLLRLLIKSKKNEINFDPNNLIDILKEKIGKNGTLLIPTFNWDFFQRKIFFPNKSPSHSGSLGNIALKRKDFLRSFNPIYSFAVTGKDKKKICDQKHNDCFSLNSPFGYLIKNKGKNLFIDYYFKDPKETLFIGFPFHHVVEQAVKIKYRYIKEFEGFYSDSKNIKKELKIKFYAHDLKLKYRVFLKREFHTELLKKKIIHKEIFHDVNFDLLDIKKSYDILKRDLNTKKKFFFKKYS